MRRLAWLLAAFALLAAAAACGKSGVRALPLRACKFHAAGNLRFGNDLVAEQPDGSLVVGTAQQHRSTLLIVLRRLSTDCRLTRSFGTNGTATLSLHSGQLVAIDTMLAAGHGRLLLAGSDGRSELVGRLLANGRLDRSFGKDGWTRVKPHEKVPRRMLPVAPLATSIGVGRGGSILLGGNDQGPHCCSQDFITELTARGAPVKSPAAAAR